MIEKLIIIMGGLIIVGILALIAKYTRCKFNISYTSKKLKFNIKNTE